MLVTAVLKARGTTEMVPRAKVTLPLFTSAPTKREFSCLVTDSMKEKQLLLSQGVRSTEGGIGRNKIIASLN